MERHAERAGRAAAGVRAGRVTRGWQMELRREFCVIHQRRRALVARLARPGGSSPRAYPLDGLLNPRDGFARAAPLPLRRAAVAVSSYDRPPRFSSDDPDANFALFGTRGSSPPRRCFALDSETFFFLFGASARASRRGAARARASVSSPATTSKSASPSPSPSARSPLGLSRAGPAAPGQVCLQIKRKIETVSTT